MSTSSAYPQLKSARLASVKTALTTLTAAFIQAGIPTPQADAQLLIGAVLHLNRGQVQAQAVLDPPLTKEQIQILLTLAKRRLTREPLQHILGTASFYGIEVSVGKGVFIPRPETEMLLAHAIAANSKHPAVIFDFCSGSGAIALALADAYPESQIIAVEKSAAATVYTRQNFARVKNPSQLWECDLAQLAAQLGVAPLPGATVSVEKTPVSPMILKAARALRGKAQMLLSNPPYVPSTQQATQAEVTEYDPPSALYSGADGLHLLRYLVPLAAYFAAPGAYFAVEHAEQQGQQVQQLFSAAGFVQLKTHPDLTGRDRFSSGYFRL